MKNTILTFLAIGSSLLFWGSAFVVPSFAACSNPGDPSCAAEVQNGMDQQNTTIILREPLIPGKTTVDVAIAQGSLGIVSQYIKMVYQYLLALGSIVGMISIMFAGLKMIVSAGDSKAQGEAKTIITNTFKSLAVLYLSGLILYVINPTFFSFGGGSG